MTNRLPKYCKGWKLLAPLVLRIALPQIMQYFPRQASFLLPSAFD
jgi:hypothetical protein